MCYTSCVCPNFWYIVDVYGIYFYFEGSDTQFYPAAFETYSRSFGSSSRSLWLFSTSWSGREKEVLLAVAGAKRGSWGEKTQAEVLWKENCAMSCCCPSSAVCQATFKTVWHIQRGKVLLLGYKTIQEGWMFRNTHSSKQSWPAAKFFFSFSWNTYSWPWEEAELWFDTVGHFLQFQKGFKRAWILFA